MNECTARAISLPIYAGPVEGTAIGNLIVQMIEAGEYPSVPGRISSSVRLQKNCYDEGMLLRLNEKC